MLRCFDFMEKLRIFVEDPFAFHENEPSQALRASSPEGESFVAADRKMLKSSPFGGAGKAVRL